MCNALLLTSISSGYVLFYIISYYYINNEYILKVSHYNNGLVTINNDCKEALN
jgi:hypothetical protein